MNEQNEVITTTLTFEYFKVNKAATVARLVHTEVVKVFGVSHEACFVETDDGREVHRDLEKEIYPMINHKKHCDKSDYHTVAWHESPRPAGWFEHIENDEAGDEEDDGERVIEIDRKTGKTEIRG